MIDRSAGAGRVALASALALFCATPCAVAQSGYFAGISASTSKAAIEQADYGPLNFTGRFTEDRTAPVLSVFGGYRFDRVWALEAGYAATGRIREAITATSGTRFLNTVYGFDYKARSLYLAGKARFDVADRLGAFVTLGVAVNRTSLRAWADYSQHIEPPVLPCPPDQPDCLPPFSKSPLFAGPDRADQTRVSPRYGAGLEYQIGAASALRLAYENLGRFGDRSQTGRFALRSLGLAYLQSF